MKLDKLRTETDELLRNPPQLENPISLERKMQLPVHRKGYSVAEARRLCAPSVGHYYDLEAASWHYYNLVGALQREVEELLKGSCKTHRQRLQNEAPRRTRGYPRRCRRDP